MNKMIDLENAPWRVIGFLIGLSLFCFCFSLTGCKHAEMPPIDVTFWAGDSARGGVTRKQENKTIPANDPEFDSYACLSYEDVRKIYDTLLTCKDWGDQPKMTRHELKSFKRYNRDVIRHVSSSPGHRY